MTLNGIDISNWQRGINLDAVPYDFVIAKATEGTSFVSSDCARQVQQVINRGKLFGVYHYINGAGAAAEMRHFYNSTKNWVRQGIFALDWESYGNHAWGNVAYLEACVVELMKLNGGIPPLLYGSLSVIGQLQTVAKKHNCGLWIAQYANNNPTGYQATPWNEGKYACAIRQYASTGNLNGYAGNLDLNKAYIDAKAWAKYANPSWTTPTPSPSNPLAGKTDAQLADEVIAGKHGSGAARIQALGARYNAVQAIVNARLNVKPVSIDVLARETVAGKHGVGAARRKALGTNYDAVQKRVNQILGATSQPKSVETLAREVIAGKHGSGQARKNALGSQYASVQKRVNQILGATKPAKSVETLAREIIAGKHGVGAARRKALGNQYDAVQKRVNQLMGR